MDASPNKVFWLCVSVVAACAVLAWRSTEVAEFFADATSSMPSLLARPHWITLGAIACVPALAVFLAITQPKNVGHWMTIVLAGWRVVRFGFAVIALGFLVWLAITLGFVVHALVVLAQAQLPLGVRNYLGDTLRVHVPIILAIGALFVVFPFLLPVAIDTVKMVVWFVRSRMSLFWAWRRRHDVGAPYLPPETTRTPDVLIVSDLHTAAPDALTLEGDLTDQHMFDFVSGSIGSLTPKVVIAAGDLTDTGAPEAWGRVRKLFGAHPVTLYPAPGNHDVNFRALASAPSRISLALEAFDLDAGWMASGSYSESSVFGEIGKVVSASTGKRGKRGRRGKREAGPDHFPILHEHPELRLSVLVLDSNRRESSSPISNAIGRVGHDQLAVAAELLAKRAKNHALVIVLHHHIFPPKLDASNVMRTFLMCVDAGAVMQLAVAHGADAIIHGHKHMPYIRDFRAGDRTIQIISAGSAMYDAKGPCAEACGHLPSAMGLVLGAGRLEAVTLHRAPAREAAAKRAS